MILSLSMLEDVGPLLVGVKNSLRKNTEGKGDNDEKESVFEHSSFSDYGLHVRSYWDVCRR